MNRIRLALTALVILFLAACSSPENFNSQGLEPQFGDGSDDIGYDVSSPFSGRVYNLWQGEFFYSDYDEPNDESLYGYFSDLNLARYDGTGKLIWSKTIQAFDCYQLDYPYCSDNYVEPLSLHSDKNGYAYSVFKMGYESFEYYIYKTDSQGNVVRRIFLGSGYPYAPEGIASLKTAVDTSGNIYAATDQYGSQTDLIASYNTSGTLRWQRTSTVGVPAGITVSSSGNVYVVGTKGYAKYTSSGNLSWSKTGSGNDIIVSGSYIYVRRGTAVLKYDGNGKQLWSKTQSGLSSPVYGEMNGDSAGNIYLSGKYAASSSNRNGFVRKLNSSGSVLWTKTFGTSAYDDVRGITSVSGSEIYITGETQGSFAHTNRGGRDGYVRELDSSGNPVWTK